MLQSGRGFPTCCQLELGSLAKELFFPRTAYDHVHKVFFFKHVTLILAVLHSWRQRVSASYSRRDKQGVGLKFGCWSLCAQGDTVG